MRDSLVFFILAMLVNISCYAREPNLTRNSKDSFFHVALFGQYSPGSKLGFGSYVSGSTVGPVITPGAAEFGTGSFTSAGLEFIFFNGPVSGFSIGYSSDSSRDIEHKQITYASGTATRTYFYPRDSMQNSSLLFNYYLIHTPERGYILLGLNYSNPKWTQATVTNSQISLSGDLGGQISMGFSLLKGVILDLTARTTSMKMKSTDPIAATFEDFGRGQIADILVGFKFIF
ncbi:MAG: hypothetical protein H7256_06085 [Bdellovibrio sp.]|nr:hypothetical protein [Bdellovibrio sp.]